MKTCRGLIHHQIIRVTDVSVSSKFYGPFFSYLGYELASENLEGDYKFQDWKRWDLDSPHEISICDTVKKGSYVRGALGNHDHIAFAAESRTDVDTLYSSVLKPLEDQNLCSVEDSPCDCPEYGAGYYATFFYDPDGLKYEFVINPNHLIKRQLREDTRDYGNS